MITYEVRLKKIGEMTIVPDSQRLFGFLINYSKKYCTESEISDFVKGVKEQEQKCMISSVVPTGYYPTPKGYIMQKLQKRLKTNREEIEKLENKQRSSKKEAESIIRKLMKKNNQKNDLRIKQAKEEKKELDKEIKCLKTKLNDVKNAFNNAVSETANLSEKNIYKTIRGMDFIEQNQLKKLLELDKIEEEIKVEDLVKIKHIKKTQTFIQKFRLESQIKNLPGLPNVAYSLPIISFISQDKKTQYEFSFFVKVKQESCIAKALDGMKNDLNKNEMTCFLGGKGSTGYNEYHLYGIEKSNDNKDEEQPIASVNYLNMGVLLPNFDNIDVEDSLLEISTSDRKPFEIENEISKVISFVTAGSVIKVKDGGVDPYKIGESIDNSKYNPLYKKNAIIFGNSYLVELEGHDEN